MIMAMSADEDSVGYVIQPEENGENGENEENHAEENGDINEDSINEEVFEELNAQLDQLNSLLDSLEKRNDNIRAELFELLKTNRETREQFQNSFRNSIQSNQESPGKED